MRYNCGKTASFHFLNLPGRSVEWRKWNGKLMAREKLELPEQIDIVEFISKEAHDLRSPFNRILGFSKMLLKGMSGPLTEVQKEDLGIVFSNSTHALNLINNLIDMARLSRGEKPFEPEDCVVKVMVSQATERWTPYNPEKQAEIEFNNIQPDLTIKVDKTLFRTALENCLAYLADYSESPVKVVIGTKEIDQQVEFTLEGQGKKSISASECDMTMWAYNARMIIELHGGQISAEGDDQGASFRFILPKSQ